MEETAFIIGASFDSVCTDIYIDHQWPRVSRDRWKDPDGRIVRYVAKEPGSVRRAFSGMKHGTRVYMAPGYDVHPLIQDIEAVIIERGFERVVL